MEEIVTEKGQVFRNKIAWELFSKTLKNLQLSKIFVLSDENTNEHCLPYFLKKSNIENFLNITISSGETHKTIATCLKVWNELSEKGADKNSLLINLGGGVVSDLGGFVASTFKRGIPFINIPTTLLAMVDASVGGKNGVDLGHIKNQIGVINPPEMVLIDTEFLKTLPEAQKIAGLAEMLKHGIIYSTAYWNRIKNIDFSKKKEFEELIWDSVAIKNEIVTKDPFEKELRKTLNYGHTLGHAIESYMLENDDRPTLLHGEAVAIGMILATHISSEITDLPKKTVFEITTTILKHFKKQFFNENDIAAIINLLIFDKKNRNGKVLFVLLQDIGVCKTSCTVDNALIYSAFNYYKKF